MPQAAGAPAEPGRESDASEQPDRHAEGEKAARRGRARGRLASLRAAQGRAESEVASISLIIVALVIFGSGVATWFGEKGRYDKYSRDPRLTADESAMRTARTVLLGNTIMAMVYSGLVIVSMRWPFGATATGFAIHIVGLGIAVVLAGSRAFSVLNCAVPVVLLTGVLSARGARRMHKASKPTGRTPKPAD